MASAWPVIASVQKNKGKRIEDKEKRSEKVNGICYFCVSFPASSPRRNGEEGVEAYCRVDA